MTQKAAWGTAKLEDFKRRIFHVIEKAEDFSAVNFTGVVFPGPISFGHFTAERPRGDIKFIAATFSGDAWFNNATLGSDAYFNNATFSGDVNFENAIFNRAWFQNADFRGEANFNHAIFNREANFNRAKFFNYAWFLNAIFSHDSDDGGKARFENATFSVLANFNSATFSGDADFKNATFSGDANFYRATFSRVADLSCSPGTSKTSSDIVLAHDAFGQVLFEDATFDGKAIFTNRKFTQPSMRTRLSSPCGLSWVL